MDPHFANAFELEPMYLRVREEAKKLAEAVAPFASEADASSSLHPLVRQALAQSGIVEFVVPIEFGGRFDRVDPLAICVIREVLMATSAHLDALFAMQGIGSYAISVAGSEAQRSQWLPRVARAEAIAGLALTEPDAGSDLRGITTTVTERDGRLTIQGRKSFISNAGIADFYTVLAKEGDRLSALLVPADAPGLSIHAGPELIAPHIIGDLVFDGVELPRDARLGAPGEGMRAALATLAVFRVTVAGAAVGLAQAALEEAVRHTRTRVQFGKPLASHGPVALMLAQSWTEVEMARVLTYRAAARAHSDPLASLHHSSMAKVAATEMAGRVVDRCVQMMGRFGLITGSRIEKLYRQARPMRIYEGATDVLMLTLARRLGEEVV